VEGKVIMTLYERISELSKKQHISVFDLAEKLGLSRNAIYSWKNSSPKTETLEKVADYFNVSLDYLQGRTDNPSMSDEEPSMAKQVMMRMDTNGLSDKELDEIESEMERFFAWRLEEIKREKNE